jgi:cytochrome c5
VISKHLLVGVLILSSLSALAVAAHPDGSQVASPVRKSSAQPPAQPQDEGEKLFQQHCSRCHNAPDGFSPRISGTVLRHMRVRASLSQHEEEVLLRFFNP